MSHDVERDREEDRATMALVGIAVFFWWGAIMGFAIARLIK